MLAIVTGFIFLLFAAATSSESQVGTWSSIREFWNHYFNYPGFEIWKFINLGLFVFGLYYISRRLKLSDVFKAKREEIRADIIKAEEDKKAALNELTSVEAKLVGVDAEKEAIMKAAREEIEVEKIRLAEQGASEAQKIKTQVDGELQRLGAVAALGLRRFSVDESLRIAEEKLRAQVDAEADSKLVKSGIRAIGGLN